MKLPWSNLSLGGLYTDTDADDDDDNDDDADDDTDTDDDDNDTRRTEHDCIGSLPNEPKTPFISSTTEIPDVESTVIEMSWTEVVFVCR